MFEKWQHNQERHFFKQALVLSRLVFGEIDAALATDRLHDHDAAEGADFLMVKPATLYLDVIAEMRRATTLPIAAYHVSGEYLMLKAAAASGWLDERQCMLEALLSIRRAGADMILTYAAPQVAAWLRETNL